MVLRRPYAFLIKYFKFIHLGIFFLVGFVFYKTYNLMNFYAEYIGDNFRTDKTSFASDHFSFLIVLVFFVLIAILVTILLLMRHKKKSIIYYVSTVTFYSILFILFFLVNGNLLELERTSVDSAIVLIYRDIINIFYYPQFLFLILTLLKALEFDIKTFSFKKELDDLDLDDEDDAEVDVSIKLDNYKVKRTARRAYREFKYYVLENRFIFSIILISVFLFFTISLLVNYRFYNTNYSENKSFVNDSFNLNFKDSFITQYDYKGDIIKEDNYYLVVLVSVQNVSNNYKKLDTGEFKIKIDDKYLEPTLDLSGRFVDLGIPYYGNNIYPEDPTQYVLVYDIGDNYLNNYVISILESYEVSGNELNSKYTHIKLNPNYIDRDINTIEHKLNKEIELNESLYSDSYLNIFSYDIKDSYSYIYNFCYDDECSESKGIVNTKDEYNNNTLLILDSELNINKDTYYYENREDDSFYDEFVKVRYTVNGKEFILEADDITPKEVDNVTILEVSKDIKNATNIEISILVRGINHRIILKS